MRIKIISIIFFSSLFYASNALADDADFFLGAGNSAIYATLKSVFVDVDDNVSGNCFTNSQAVKTAVELSLRKSGIEVPEKENFFPKLSISVIGFRNKTKSGLKIGCVAYVYGTLSIWTSTVIPFSLKNTLVHTQYNIGGRLGVSADENGLHIKETAVDIAEKLENAILASRSKIKKKFPEEFKKISAGLTAN